MDSSIKSEDAMITHRFKIENYSYTKGRGVGKSIKSSPFNVGGNKLIIKFYPDGFSKEHSDYMSVYIGVKSKLVNLTVTCSFSLLNHTTKKPDHTMKYEPRTFTGDNDNGDIGFGNFIKRESFEASDCLKGDTLTIICNVTIVDNKPVSSRSEHLVPILPSDIHERLKALLNSKKGADITIEVGGKTFEAHKCILAASSPVLDSEIFCWFKSEKNNIKIDNIDAVAFEAMLHFIYTDTLPEIEDHEILAVVPCLLEAADRFQMRRLKLACERKLGDSIGHVDIGDVLALAGKYKLNHLKEHCVNLLASPKAFTGTIESEGFKQILMNHTDTAKDIISRMIEKL